jgi:hypothetical protein
MVRQIARTNAYSTFLLGLKAPETQRQWPKRLKFFLDFVEIIGDNIEDRTNLLYETAQMRHLIFILISKFYKEKYRKLI